MDFSIGINSSFFRNYKRSSIFDDDLFSVFVNNEKIEFPLFLATMISSEISKLINKDSTIRTFNIDIHFRGKKSKQKILRILETGQQGGNERIENDEEILDFADFGTAFGSEMFIKPFTSLICKLKKEGINENNAISLIESKDIISLANEEKSCIDQEIEYISSNFSAFCDKERFIEWCERKENEERVEQIIRNEKFHISKEDDLFNFIMCINKDKNRFVNLFSYVHLEFCTAECCKQLIEMIGKGDLLQSKNYRNSVLACISRKLLYGTGIEYDDNSFNSRYPVSFIKTINEKSSPLLSNELGKTKKNDKITKEFSKKTENKLRYHGCVEKKDSKGLTPINKASLYGDLETVKYLYEEYQADVETTDCNGNTPISNAGNNDHLDVVKYLYETCHANINIKGKDAILPINSASKEGNLKFVKYLYETCHASVETKNNIGNTPINYASENGHLEVVKYLYETCHADVEVKDCNGFTPINNASKNGHLEVVKYLYKTCHADVETKDRWECTPINYASINGHLNVVKYLYETCHANVEIKDNYYGRTPINNASLKGHLEIVKYLYETCHAKVDNYSIINASKDDHFEVVKYLYETCHVNVPDNIICQAKDRCKAYFENIKKQRHKKLIL